MNVLMIHKFHFVVGGAERYLFELSEMLERRGHRVVPFAMRHERNRPTPWDRHFVGRVEFAELSRAERLLRGPALAARVLWSRAAVRALEGLLDEFQPDVAHVHMIDHQLSPSVLHVLRRRGIPALQTVHQYKLVCPNYRLYVPQRQRICERCVAGNHLWPLVERCHMDSFAASAAVVAESYLHRALGSYAAIRLFHAPSRFLASRLERGGVAPERIWHQPLSLDLERHPFSDAVGDALVYFGRLTPEKGVATLLRAMRRVRGVPLRILGEGAQRPELERYAAEHGLDHVEFLGFREGPALRRAVAEARAVVVPSEWHDNAPMTIAESMALGRPVITTPLGGIPELVQDDVNGRLFPAGDAGALADVLNGLVSDPERLRRLGRAGRELAEARFDPELHCARVIEQYRRVAS